MGYKCFCGYRLNGVYGTALAASECPLSCPGDGNKCGGNNQQRFTQYDKTGNRGDIILFVDVLLIY